MKLRTNAVDVWAFHKADDEPKYLLLRTSQEKADKWFFGDRFWQITGGFVEDGETLVVAAKRWLADYSLFPIGIWAAEHVYSFYSTRRENLEIVPVFASEVAGPVDVPLSWEHSEYGWYTAEECLDRIKFRGLIEGLQATRKYISEVDEPHGAYRIL
ncbi:NUDIX domain-containing protein [Candidatus Bipolaricaulota bacterium]